MMPEIIAVIDTGQELCRGVTLKRWEHICYLTKDEIFELGRRGLRELFKKLGKQHPEAKWLKLKMRGIRRHYGLHEFDTWLNPYRRCR
ncbi:hypothetical protein [Candidatus Pyrohabitans sp.]